MSPRFWRGETSTPFGRRNATEGKFELNNLEQDANQAEDTISGD